MRLLLLPLAVLFVQECSGSAGVIGADSSCAGRDDGRYAVAGDPCTHAYWTCSNNAARRETCPGKRTFDSESGDCRTSCSTPACGTPFACNGEVGLVAVGKCMPMHLECEADGSFKLKSCSATLDSVFDPYTQKVVPVEDAGCVPPRPALNCSLLRSGTYAFSGNPCTDLYYECVDGSTLRRVCAKGTYYDLQSGICDFAAHVRACGGTPRPPPPPTTEAPETDEGESSELEPVNFVVPPFDCSLLRDGDYPWYPDGPCEAIYASCVGGQAFTRSCADGLYFDETTNLCLEPQYIGSCGGKPTALPPTSTAGEPKPTTTVPLDCSALEDGDYSWSPDLPCESDYVSCVGGRGYRRSCVSGLFFDDRSRRCLQPQYVAACGGKPTEVPKPTAGEPKPTEEIPFDCSDLDDGDYAWSADGSCESDYLSCSGGRAHLRYCQGGLFFDAISRRCLERQYVLACGGNPTEVPVTTTLDPKTSTVVLYDCSGRPDGDYPWYDVAPCERDYVSCVGGKAYQRACQLGLFFDDITRRCLQPEYVLTCGGKPTEVPKPTEAEPTEPVPFDCTGLPDGDYAWARGKLCESSYVSCSGGVAYRRTCGALFFDVISRRCLEPQYVQACGGHPTKIPPTTTSKPTTAVPYDCSGLADGDYPMNPDYIPFLPEAPCERDYVSCVGGKAYRRSCQAGLFFDGDSRRCLGPEYVLACGGKPTEIPKPTEAEPTEPVPFDCTGLVDGDYAWAQGTVCESSYVSCSGGVAHRRTCGALFFDGLSRRCLEPQYVQACGGQPTKIPPSTTSRPTTAVPYDCSGLADGDYPMNPDYIPFLPGAPCERDYVSCVGGKAYRRSCQAGLFFDGDSRRCLGPEYVLACGGKPTEIPKPTEAEPTEPVPYDCAGLDDGDYPMNPDYIPFLPQAPCERDYVSCAGGTAYRRSCPSGLYFDGVSRRCLEPEYVAACGGTPTAVPTTGKPGPTPTPVPFDCSELEDGDYTWSYERPCDHLYATCVAGRAYRRTCPSGLYFDAHSSRCVAAEFAAGCGGQPTEPPPTTTTEAGATPPPFDCTGLPDGDYPWYADGPCERVFATCTAGETTTRTCPKGLFFDKDSGLCLEPQYVALCGGKPTEPPSATTGPPPAETPDYGFDCAGKQFGNYPDHEDSCSGRFFTCSPVGVIRNHCPGGLFYDMTLDKCDRYDNVPACVGTPHPETLPTEKPAEPTEPTPVPFDCTGRDDGEYAAGPCANVYFQCGQGTAYVRQCPGSLRFSEDAKACLTPSDLPGCLPGEGEFDPTTFCEGKPNGFYADPSKCDGFLICARNVMFRFDCPPDTVFDAGHTQLCLPKDQVRLPCGSQIDPETFTCEGRSPGFYSSALSCGMYYHCAGNGAMSVLQCDDGYAFHKGTCKPCVDVPGCHRPKADDLVDICTGDDWIYPHPSNCNDLIVCAYGYPFVFRCPHIAPYYDHEDVACVSYKPIACEE